MGITIKRRRGRAVVPPEDIPYLTMVWSEMRGTGPVVSSIPVFQEMQIGRAGQPPEILAVDDPAISANHCLIRHTAGGWFLEDLGSTNGTFLNGVQVSAGKLAYSDVISLGGSVFVVTRQKASPVQFSQEDFLHPSSGAMREAIQLLQDKQQQGGCALVYGEPGTGRSTLVRRSFGGTQGTALVWLSADVFDGVESPGQLAKRLVDTVAATGGAAESVRSVTLVLDDLVVLPLPVANKLAHWTLLKPELARQGLLGDKVAGLLGIADGLAVHGGASESLWSRLCKEGQWTPVLLPGLRQRREEIIALIWHHMVKVGSDPAKLLTDQFLEAALLHSWPDNLPELWDCIDQCLALASPRQRLTAGLFSEASQQTTERLTALRPSSSAPTSSGLKWAISNVGGNVAELVRRTNWSRRQIYRWIQHYDITLPQNRYRRSPRSS